MTELVRSRSHRATDVALTALRIVVGIVFIAHGVQKLADPGGTAGAFANMGLPMPSVLVWLAILGEFVGGLALMVGALTRVAALGPLATMVVAVFWVHLDNGLFAQKGGFEYPLVLLLVSAVYVAYGGGPYSVDAWVQRMRSKHDVLPNSSRTDSSLAEPSIHQPV